MFCPMCGKEIDDGSVFCPECGADLRQPQTSQPAWPQAYASPAANPGSSFMPAGATAAPGGAPKKKGSGGKTAVLVIAAAAVLAVIGTVGYLASGRLSGGSGKTDSGKTSVVSSDTGAADARDISQESIPEMADQQDANAQKSDHPDTDPLKQEGIGKAGAEQDSAADSGKPGSEETGTGESGAAGHGQNAESASETAAAAEEEPSVSEYQAICAGLRLQQPAAYAGGADIMERMLRPLTDSDILDKNMTLRMSDLPQDKPDHFDWDIIYDFVDDLDSYGVRNSSSEYGRYINLSDLDGFLADYYGGRALTWNLPKDVYNSDYIGFLYADEDTVEIQFADGDPWVFGENPQFRENADYCLVSMPCYYGDNGGADHVYTYDLDALFEKNPSSRFGVTLRYAETSYSNASAMAASSYYIMNCDEWVTLRSAASTKASSILHIPLYSKVSYLGDAGNEFARVSYNGYEGYVLKQYVSPYGPTVSGYPYRVVNARESITLRTDPSTSGAEILQIPVGAEVTVYRFTSSEFYLVEYNGLMGYAMASYLQER